MSKTINNQETRAMETRPQGEATFSQPTFLPNVDIFETQEELLLLADMPGVSSDRVDLTFEKGQLVLHGRVERRQKEDQRYLRSEYATGDFYRVFEVSESIDASKISAEMRGGVLRLHLPKAESIKPRRIEIK